MECIKVLQIGVSSYPGGVENATMNYFRSLNRERVCFDFVCMEDSLAYSEEIQRTGGKIYYLPSPKDHMLQFARELRDVINGGHYDVVHVNMLSAVNLLPVLFSQNTYAKRIVAHAHNSGLPRGGMKKAAHYVLKPLIPLLTKEWMACSPEAAEWLFGKHNVPKVRIMNNAIDFERFRFNSEVRKRMRKQYGLDESIPVIGHVGRFNEEKNHQFLLRIFQQVKRLKPDAMLLLVGAGPLQEPVRQQAARMGLSDSVIFVGGVEDTSPYYQMMDVFCLPSVFEGLGIVAIEAQASGLPCVCSMGVPQTAILTEEARRLALDDEKAWVCQTHSMLAQGRTESAEKNVQQAGYHIVLEAAKLEKYYQKGVAYGISQSSGNQP